MESIILDECLRCAIEHAGANEPLATRLAKIRSHLPVRIGEMGITETAALLPKS